MASNDLSEPKLPEESRFGLLADALEQSSHKIIHNILRYNTILSTSIVQKYFNILAIILQSQSHG